MERILNPFSIAIKLEKEILDITSSKVNIYFSALDAMLIKNIYISSLPHLLRFLEATTKFSGKDIFFFYENYQNLIFFLIFFPLLLFK